MILIIGAHRHQPHMVGFAAHQQAVFHPELPTVFRDGDHEILVGNLLNLPEILRMDDPLHVSVGLGEEIGTLGGHLQFFIVVARRVLHIVVGRQIHIVDRGIAVGERPGDLVVHMACPPVITLLPL